MISHKLAYSLLYFVIFMSLASACTVTNTPLVEIVPSPSIIGELRCAVCQGGHRIQQRYHQQYRILLQKYHRRVLSIDYDGIGLQFSQRPKRNSYRLFPKQLNRHNLHPCRLNQLNPEAFYLACGQLGNRSPFFACRR